MISNSEDNSSINWDVYNKISNTNSIKYTSEGFETRDATFLYDAFGNRVKKTQGEFIFTGYPTEPVESQTFYVRDAHGNILSTYSKLSIYYKGLAIGNTPQKEVYLYGSSRIGNIKLDRKQELPYNYKIGSKTPTSTHYELSNHLGNVLTTVTGRKLGIDANSDGIVDHYEPEVVQASDYYPFGAEMPGRTYRNPAFSGTNDYRFGFNEDRLVSALLKIE